MSADYFEVFELPRRLAVDTAALQRRFYELARRHHPDFHQAAPPEERARAERESALVNAAYRALRDPIARVEYLVRLEGGHATDGDADPHAGRRHGDKPTAPPELLQEMFEIQEALAEAKAGALDAETRATLVRQRDTLRERHAAEETRLRGPLSEAWDRADAADRPRALAALKAALAARAYLGTVIEDLDAVLDEGQESHVAHHRH